MSQVIQYDKNPAAEGAAVRVSRGAATPTIATDTFTSWPPQGTKSHKIVATAATLASTGMPNADRPAAAAGQVWSARATLRNSAAAARDLAVSIVFYDTVGATLGTVTGTFTTTLNVAAATIATISVDGATAPAGTASVDIQIQRNATSGAATSDTVHSDRHTLTRTATAVAYIDPNLTGFATWSGTANASTQIYFTPVLVATPVTTEDPAPRIRVTVDDLPPSVTKLTLYRIADGRTFKVRGAVDQPVAGGFAAEDIEAPFQVISTYRAQMRSSIGTDLGYTATAAATLAVTDTWVHNPLAPSGATKVDITEASGRALTRPSNGEIFYPENRSLGVLIASRRRGLQGVELFFSTDSAVAAAKFEAMLGGYDDTDQLVPVLCIRTPPFIDIPRTFYAGTLELTKMPVTVHMGGTLREWSSKPDEVSPPAPGILIALLTRNDIDAFYATRNLLDTAYSSRLAIDRDYTKAGTA